MVLNDVFKIDGLLKKSFPQYIIRDGQIKMAELVEKALRENKSAVIEGATGIGKGFAYLIPIILSGETTIITTSNKNLQNQLDRKDLPTLAKVFKGTDHEHTLTWTVLKGKNNYFCYEHFDSNKDEIKNELIRSKNVESSEEADIMFQNIAKWSSTDSIGDLEYLPFDLPQRVRELIACDNQTTHEKGSDGAERCFAQKARLRAKSSQIVLANHTLLALDIALKKESEGRAQILPETQAIIIDEAHEFEKSAILAFSDDISLLSLYHLLNWSIVRKHYSKTNTQALIFAFKSVLNNYLPEKGEKYYSQRKVVKFEGFDRVITGIGGIIDSLSTIKGEIDEKIQIKIREIKKEAQNLQTRLAEMMTDDDNMLRWSEARENGKGDPLIRLKSVPLDISNMLREGLFKEKTVICTSATLAVHNKFDFFRIQVGMPDSGYELVVDSPFDYKKQALIYISDGSQDREWEVEQLLKYSKGRAFVLFTSYLDMRRVFSMVNTDYPKMMQGDEGLTRAQLLDKFLKTPNAILFGTKSFWEGVDIGGDKLSLVIIWKIPFENPRDLVFSSKCDKIDQKAGKSVAFFRYAIPDACLKLKQGVGRLIRSTTDTGVIALLDARVNYANYKDMIINSLPPAYRTQQLEKVQYFFNKLNNHE